MEREYLGYAIGPNIVFQSSTPSDSTPTRHDFHRKVEEVKPSKMLVIASPYFPPALMMTTTHQWESLRTKLMEECNHFYQSEQEPMGTSSS